MGRRRSRLRFTDMRLVVGPLDGGCGSRARGKKEHDAFFSWRSVSSASIPARRWQRTVLYHDKAATREQKTVQRETRDR